MNATTARRKVYAHQIKTTSVIRGWHCWNDYRGGVVVQAMQQDGEWVVSRKPEDSTTPGEYVEVARVKTLAQVREAIAALYNGEDPKAAAEVAPARRKAAAALSPVEEGVKVGDFFYASWGYDQTNIEFFQVVGLGAKSVKVKKVAQEVVDSSGYSDAVVPAKDAFVWNEAETKVLRPCGRKGGALSFSSYKSAWLWDGTPKHQTAAGWGH